MNKHAENLEDIALWAEREHEMDTAEEIRAAKTEIERLEAELAAVKGQLAERFTRERVAPLVELALFCEDHPYWGGQILLKSQAALVHATAIGLIKEESK